MREIRIVARHLAVLIVGGHVAVLWILERDDKAPPEPTSRVAHACPDEGNQEAAIVGDDHPVEHALARIHQRVTGQAQVQFHVTGPPTPSTARPRSFWKLL